MLCISAKFVMFSEVPVSTAGAAQKQPSFLFSRPPWPRLGRLRGTILRQSMLQGVVTLGSVTQPITPAPPCRDRFFEPFSSTSIWNVAIGESAKYAHAGIYLPDGPCGSPPCNEATDFHNDQDFFIRATPSDPLTPWIDQGDWGADDHCKVHGVEVARIPLPAAWTTASDAGRSAPGQPNNNAMGVLLLDNRTIVQMQPAYRCAPGAPLLARWGNGTDGCPQRFPNITDIFGDGALGSHGGSGLSGVGGTIRLGELTGATPIAHALKLELQHEWYFGLHPLQPPSTYNQGRRQYVWPATGSDSCSHDPPRGCYGGTMPSLAPGALLALPSANASALRMRTPVGAKIKQALTDYGGYLVDDTGGSNSAAICMEAAVNLELRQAYGYTMTYPHGVDANVSSPGHALYADLLAIFQSLHVVVNNGPSTVGGGGTPRRPRKPPICD